MMMLRRHTPAKLFGMRRLALSLCVLAVAAASGAEQHVVEITVSSAHARGACAFHPTSVHAAPGDVLGFVFSPGDANTTPEIAQGRPDAPCAPHGLGLRVSAAQGRVVVNASEPLFFHCATGPARCTRGAFVAVNDGSPLSVTSEQHIHTLARRAVATEWVHLWAIIISVVGGLALLLIVTCCGCMCFGGLAGLCCPSVRLRSRGPVAGRTDEPLPAYEPRRDAGVQVPAYNEDVPAYMSPTMVPERRDGVELHTIANEPVQMPTPPPAAVLQAATDQPSIAVETTTSQPRLGGAPFPREQHPPQYAE